MFYSSPNPSNDDQSTSDSSCELIRDIIEGRSAGDSLNSIDKKKAEHSAILHEFMIMLSVCHTVIPEKVDDSIIYHAASPGERQSYAYLMIRYVMLHYVLILPLSLHQTKGR